MSKPGKWLQLGVMGYYAPRFDKQDSYYGQEGWETFSSNFEPFSKLSGGGLSLSYKNIFDNQGWYYSAGLMFNHYSVDYEILRYLPVVEDELTFYERKIVLRNTKYNRPAVFFNIGKHASITKDVFVDFYLGLGYMHGFYSGGINPFDGYGAFGFRGAYFNGGFRIGVLPGQGKK